MAPPLRGAVRLLLFAGAPVIGAVAPLIVLPALTRALGEPGWASLAVGQSAGLFGALLVNWGWSVEGPASAARAGAAERAELYAASVRGRSLTAAFALPVVAAIALLVAPDLRTSAAVTAVAVCLSGALPSWFFVGTGSPVLLAVFDGLPRVVAAVTAALVLPVVRSEWVYPLLLLAVTLAAVVVPARLLTGRVLHPPGRADRASVRQRLLLVASGVVSSGYTTLAVPLVGVVAPAAIASFAAAGRIQGFAALGLGAATSATQGWVSARGVPEPVLLRRRRLALLGNTAAGLVAGAVLAVALPPLVRLLFSGTVTPPPSAGPLVGGIVLMLAISLSTTFHLLVPAGRTRAVAVSGIVTSVVGVPLLAVLAAAGGAEGALVAILVAETISAGLQLAAHFGRAPLRR